MSQAAPLSQGLRGQPAPAPAPQPRRGGKVAVGSGAERTPRSEENRCPAPAHSARRGRPVPTGTKRAGSRPAGEGPQPSPHLGPSQLPRIPTPSARGAAHPAGALCEVRPSQKTRAERSWLSSAPREVLRPSLGSPHTPRRAAAEGPATKPATLDNPRSARRLFIRPKTRSLLCSDSSPGVLVLEGQPGVGGRKFLAEHRKRSRHFQLEILNTHRANL